MLPGNQSVSPARTYRRIRAAKADARRNDTSASSSTSDDDDNERSALLKAYDRQVVDRLRIPDRDGSEDNIYSKNYDSHRARRGTICRQPGPRARTDVSPRHPRETKFTTRQLPRYVEARVRLLRSV